jgi:galactoside O-acetyltransferase
LANGNTLPTSSDTFGPLKGLNWFTSGNWSLTTEPEREPSSHNLGGFIRNEGVLKLKILGPADRIATTHRILEAATRSFFARQQLGSCGDDFTIYGRARTFGGENIKVGGAFRALQGLSPDAKDGFPAIGNHCSLNSNVSIDPSQGKITIGNRVLIGPNVVLRAADHDLGRERIMRFAPHLAGEITVEDDVWIRANAVLTRNVRIGKGAAVASGAVVTSDVAPNTVDGGVPARLLAQR